MEKSLVIGLTGGVGTGKSAVASILEELGLKVIDADQIAHQQLRPGTEVYRQVLTAFGTDILKPDGRLTAGDSGRSSSMIRKKAVAGGDYASGD